MKINRENFQALIAVVVFVILLLFCSKIDAGYESGYFRKTVPATVYTVILTEDGEEYIVNKKEKVVGFNTHDRSDPRQWTPVEY